MQSHIDVIGLGLVGTIVVVIWLLGAYMHNQGNTTFPDEMIRVPGFLCVFFGNFRENRCLHYPTMFAQLLFLMFGIIYSLFELGYISHQQENDGLFWLIIIFSLLAIGITILRRRK